jgi:uncharacterized protein DUF4129
MRALSALGGGATTITAISRRVSFARAVTEYPRRAMNAVRARTVAVAMALTALICGVAIAGREPPHGTAEDTAGASRAPADAKRVAMPKRGPLPPEVFVFYPDEEPATPAWIPWTIVGLGVVGVVTAGLLLVRDLRVGGKRRRRRRGRRRAPRREATAPSMSSAEDDAEVARRVVEAALKPLRDSTDPRAAVIAAYARMEQVLAERQLGRRTPEAPREYLARVLREHGMPARSLATLTALFEEARFSQHVIPQSAPGRALSELENARVALGAAMEKQH